jgi:hypothetical protein
MARLAASLVVVPLVSPVKQGGYQPEVRRLEKLLYPRIHIRNRAAYSVLWWDFLLAKCSFFYSI